MQSETQKGLRISTYKCGKKYEKLVVEFFAKKGVKVLETNVFTVYGEADIVCVKEDRLIIVEVKGGKRLEEIYERFNRKKLQRLKLVGQFLCQKYSYKNFQIDGFIVVATEGNAKIIQIKNIV
ncbi:MAG TPA: YraN family protein [Exilispira sp.]|nr:YraN family protein [Exilispira sp.]